MPNYVTLVKWTEDGAKSIKESPARLKAAATLTEAMGGKSPTRTSPWGSTTWW